MPRVVMDLNSPTLKVATTEAGLSAGTAIECQTTSAVISAQPKYSTTPATGCAGETQKPGLSGWQLDLAWLQDWTAPGGGFSGFAFENDGKEVWFELTPDKGNAAVKFTGHGYAVAGSAGGTFGDGSAPNSTATWPLLEKPDATYPVALTVAADVDVPAAGPEVDVDDAVAV